MSTSERSPACRPTTRNAPDARRQEPALSLSPLVLVRYGRSIRHGRCPRFDSESLVHLGTAIGPQRSRLYAQSLSLLFPRTSFPLSAEFTPVAARLPSLSRQLSRPLLPLSTLCRSHSFQALFLSPASSFRMCQGSFFPFLTSPHPFLTPPFFPCAHFRGSLFAWRSAFDGLVNIKQSSILLSFDSPRKVGIVASL